MSREEHLHQLLASKALLDAQTAANYSNPKLKEGLYNGLEHAYWALNTGPEDLSQQTMHEAFAHKDELIRQMLPGVLPSNT
jgi:hypothetical protein